MATIKQTKAELLSENEKLKKQIAKLKSVKRNRLLTNDKKDYQSEKDYWRIFNEAHDSIIVFEPKEEVILDVNQRTCEVYGYERSELIGMSLKKISKLVSRGEQNIKKTIEKGTYKHFETIHLCKDGREIQLEINASIIEYMGQKAILSINRDMTERKKADEAIRESERKLSTIIDNIPGMTYRCLMDEFWTIKFISKGCKEITGYSQLELLDNKELYLIHLEDKEMVRRVALKTLDTQKQFELEYRIVRKDGSIRWVWERGLQIDEKMNGIPLLEGIIEDITEKKIAQEALKEAYDIINKSPAIPFLWKKEEGWPVEYVSENVVDLFEYTAEEFMSGKVSYSKLIHPEDLERVENEVTRHSLEEGAKRFSHKPYRIVTKSGKIKWVEDKTYFRRDENNNINQYQGIVEDITTRKLSEMAHLESEERYRAVVEQSKDCIFLADVETKLILDANPAMQKLLGYTSEEIKDITLYNFIIRDKESIDRNTELIVRDGYLFVGERQYARKDGSKIFVEVSASLISYGDKKVMCVVSRDITEKVFAEKAIREREERFRNVLENIQLIGLMLDKDGRLTFANDFLLNLTGWKREETIGKNWFDNFLPDDVREKVKILFYETINTGVFPLSYQNEIVTKEGELRLISWSNIVHRSNNKKTYAVTSIGEDITERKKAEKKLRDSHYQLRSLAERLQMIREEERAAVSREIHDDLGQVLTALKMDISSLQKKSNLEKSEIIARTDKMMELVNSSIQTVKRIATELRPGILDDLGLFPAIEWQAEEFQNRTKINCQLEIEGEMDLIDDDISIAVFRVFQETLTNIMRHSNATNTVIKLVCSNEYLMLEVQDNGKGTSKEELYGPRSLGILGMRERVHILRGGFEVSGDPGKGTRVTIKIPLRKKEIV